MGGEEEGKGRRKERKEKKGIGMRRRIRGGYEVRSG